MIDSSDQIVGMVGTPDWSSTSGKENTNWDKKHSKGQGKEDLEGSNLTRMRKKLKG